MAQVTMTMEEYLALVNGLSSEPAQMSEMVEPSTKPKRRSRASRAQDKKLSAAFTEANQRYRKNDGSLRSGRTQADIARLAHKLAKQM